MVLEKLRETVDGRMPRWKWIGAHVLIGWGAWSASFLLVLWLGAFHPIAEMAAFAVLTLVVWVLERNQAHVPDQLNDLTTYLTIPAVITAAAVAGGISVGAGMGAAAGALALGLLVFLLTLSEIYP